MKYCSCRFTFAAFVLRQEAVGYAIKMDDLGYAGEIWDTRLPAGAIWNQQVSDERSGGGGGRGTAEMSVISS